MADNDEKPQKPPLPGFGKPPLPGSGGKPPVPPPLPGASMPGLPPGLPPIPGLSSGAPKPPMPPGAGLPPGFGSKTPAPPSLNMPPIPPGMPGMQGMKPLPPMGAVAAPAAPAVSQKPEPPTDEKLELERKLAALEKRLAEEREKLLIATVKREEEAATAAKVEISIKELQEKLRRDRREQESEESKHKLESRLQEMEQKLAQERETWVVTLRNQLQARESQDKELEAHFGLRVQEMERRWLEEKAQWQKVVMTKDEEIRTLRSLAEKLKGADVELQKIVSEKKWLETRVHELTQERAEAVAKLSAAAEREKESIQLRADLSLSRQQVQIVQDRLERDLQSLRMSSKEREERLMSDHERLQRELATLESRLRGEQEAEKKRLHAEHEAEMVKYKEAVERGNSDVQKLRGVAGAMERQLAAARAQLGELAQARAAWEKTQERYKAEFVVLQRKWVEREKEIRAEAEARGAQLLEAEKARIKILAQEEINARAAKIAEQLDKDGKAQLQRAESAIRAELERQTAERMHAMQADFDKGRRELEAEIERLHQDLFKKESEWAQRLLAKDSETHKASTEAQELAAKLRTETAARQQSERLKLELETALQDAREQAAKARAELEGVKLRSDELGRERSTLASRQEELERLCTAQAAQVQNLQDLLEQARGELAREVHLARLYMKQKEQAEASAAARPEAPKPLPELPRFEPPKENA